METETFKLYTHFASSFINDDSTALSDDELKQVETIQEEITDILGTDNWSFAEVSEESEFARPEIGPVRLLGDVSTFTVVYYPKPTVGDKEFDLV